MNKKVGFTMPNRFWEKLAFLALTGIAQAQVIEDANIRTWTSTFTGWNMEPSTGRYKGLSLAIPAEIKYDAILGIKVMIYSDGSLNSDGTSSSIPEVFNLSRMGNKRSNQTIGHNAPRAGGWAEVNVYNDRQIYVSLDRGPCIRNTGGTCSDKDVQSFFAAHSSYNGVKQESSTFPNAKSRTFFSTSRPRGVIKIDYSCSTCGTPSTKVFWKKIGNWNMTDGSSRHFPEADLGVNASGIVDMSATIYSDPVGTSGKIIVDDLEHSGAKGSARPNFRGRGGYLWFGHGCIADKPNGCYDVNFSKRAYRLFPGPQIAGAGVGTPSVYRDYGFNYDGQYENVYYADNAKTPNRGWLRVEYTGAKSGIKVPYVFRSRATTIGPWPMDVQEDKTIPFSRFGLAASRIARIVTTIRSNQVNFDNGRSYFEYSNIFRPKTQSGAPEGDTERKSGGVAYIDESRDIIAFRHGQYDLNWYPDYYRQGFFGGSADRGYVLIDYLAGSCEQGGNGFSLRAIPSSNSESCTGTGNLVLEASGSASGINGTKDDFVYAYKQTGGTTHTTIARLSSQDNFNSNALSGIMVRSSLNDNARFVAALVKPFGGGYVRYRNGDGQSAGQISFSSNANPWLRIDFAAPNFYIYYSNSSTMPTNLSQWTYIGPVSISTFPTVANSYYVGVASTNANHSRLQRSTFTISGTF